jgi:glycosyltransferase involved in cell wall biosynthesis
LVRVIVRNRIEVVHWNFCPPLWNSYPWALTLLVPWVKHYFTDHNSRLLPMTCSGGAVKKAVKTLLLKRYRKVFCVSRFVQECLQDQQTWSNLICCTHFINTDRFKPDGAARSAVRAAHGVEGKFVVLAVAYLIKAKGIDVVLRALAELPDSVVLWIIGEGEEATNLQTLCRELGLEDRVRFLGLQRHVEPFMQAADCLVCPSLWAEAAGLVNVEAHACGLPVLASRIGGIPEYVEEGRTGFLFTPGDHGQLAEKIRRLHSAPAVCRGMGRAARAMVVERFSAESRLSEYLDLYRVE